MAWAAGVPQIFRVLHEQLVISGWIKILGRYAAAGILHVHSSWTSNRTDIVAGDLGVGYGRWPRINRVSGQRQAITPMMVAVNHKLSVVPRPQS